MERWINFGSTSYPELDIKKLEGIKNAKFVCELAIKGKFGWTESPAQIYYQETPPVPGYSNYFALIYQMGQLYITTGESVVGIPIEGIETEAGEIIFSRFRHDFRKAQTADVSVDGGLDYLRVVGDIHSKKNVVLTIKDGSLVVVDDKAEIDKLYEKKNGRQCT